VAIVPGFGAASIWRTNPLPIVHGQADPPRVVATLEQLIATTPVLRIESA
jgi:hypothetical protein